MYGPEYQNIIQEICKNNGIEFELFDGRCALLSYNGKKQYIWSRRFPHNTASCSRLIDSKSVCSLVLNSAGLPVITHSKLYRSDTEGYISQKKTSQEICENVLKSADGAVIKPNDSYEGKDVYACFSPKEIEFALLKAFQKKEILTVSPYVDASAEYRVFYLDGRCLMAYKKIRPYVIGDGISSLLTLISRIDVQDIDLYNTVDFTRVPAAGEKVSVGWKFNLSRGSIPEIVCDKELENLVFSLAEQAAKVIDAQFVTIDLLENRQTKKLSILEINAGVAMDQFIIKHPHGKTIAYKIYEKAIQNIFMSDN